MGFKGCLRLEKSLSPLCLFSFPIQVPVFPVTCFGHCLECLTVTVPTECIHGLKSREQCRTIETISVKSGLVHAWSDLKSEARGFHRESFSISPFKVPNHFLNRILTYNSFCFCKSSSSKVSGNVYGDTSPMYFFLKHHFNKVHTPCKPVAYCKI